MTKEELQKYNGKIEGLQPGPPLNKYPFDIRIQADIAYQLTRIADLLESVTGGQGAYRSIRTQGGTQ